MRNTRVEGRSFLLPAVFALVLAALFVWTATAQAQSPEDRSADVQYEKLSPPSGPLAEITPTVTPDGALLIEGELCVAPGASVMVEDTTGTRAVFISGEGATIAETPGGVLVSGEPQNVAGGNGSLEIENASVVTSAGISQQCSEETAILSALPDTAGASLVLLALGVALTATGVAAALMRRSNRR